MITGQLSFAIPTDIHYGAKAALKLADICCAHNASSITAIIDGNVRDRAEPILSDVACPTVHYHSGEPTAADVDRLSAKIEYPDLIVAIGGGSTIDLAKAIRAMINRSGSVLDYAGIDTITDPPVCPLVAIPTTAGTGADLTAGSVLCHGPEKFIVASPALLPDYSLSDPELTLSIPPDITAQTGFDALAQAIGAYTSNYAQPLTDAFALSSVAAAYYNLPLAVGNPSKLSFRTGMMYASMSAGIAMSIADCVADHFFAEAIGAYYHINHGLAVAWFLPETMAYNRVALPEKMADLAAAMGQDIRGHTLQSASHKAIEAVTKLRKQLPLASPADCGCKMSDIQKLAKKTASHIGVQLGLNPRPITEASAKQILTEVFHQR